MCKKRKQPDQKLSTTTNQILKERIKLDKGTNDYNTVNKVTKKAIQKDIRAYKNKIILETIENKS